MKASRHWKTQRQLAVLLLFLIPWFAINLVGKTYPQMVHYFKTGYPFFGLIALWFIAFCHGLMGVEVILDDYVHNETAKKRIIRILEVLFWGIFSFLLSIIFK